MEIVLDYNDKDILVKAYKKGDYWVVPTNLLQNGVFPNGKKYYVKDNEIYKTEIMRSWHVAIIAIAIILIISGIVLIYMLKKSSGMEWINEWDNGWVNY